MDLSCAAVAWEVCPRPLPDDEIHLLIMFEQLPLLLLDKKDLQNFTDFILLANKNFRFQLLPFPVSFPERNSLKVPTTK